MIDFHSHILPHMDDGSKSVEESLKMLEMLSQQDVSRVIATPHFNANSETVRHFINRRTVSFENLKPHISQEHPEIFLGAEVKYYQGISRLENLRELCIEKSNILLLEMPSCKWSEYIVSELVDMSGSGLNVVLAHVERYMFFQSSAIMERLFHCGVYFQFNSEFFISRFSRRKAFKMMKNQMVGPIGSDCHNLESRPPNIGEAVELIEKKFGKSFVYRYEQFLENLFVQN